MYTLRFRRHTLKENTKAILPPRLRRYIKPEKKKWNAEDETGIQEEMRMRTR
jgi:hypothetical protein